MKIRNTKRIRYSSYAAIMMAGVIIVLLLINYLFTSLDERYNLSADMTVNRLYSLSSTTIDVLGMIKEDIFIYTTQTAGIEDVNVQELLKNYVASSPYIHVVNMDIVKNPAAIEYYNEFSKYQVTVGSIIISNSADTSDREQRYKVLDFSDLYVYDEESQSYDEFIAEDSLTGAIKYIVKPTNKKIWLLDNHSQDNADNIAMESMLKSENYTVDYLDILNGQSELISTDIVIIIDLENDITSIELDILNDFLIKGGKMIIGIDSASNSSNNLSNVLSLFERYNISMGQGVVLETDLNNIAVTNDSQYMHSFIIPIYEEHEITNEFIINNYKLLLGMNVGYINLPEKINNPNVIISPLLYTSESSFAEKWRLGMDSTPDEDAVYGEFAVMAAVTENQIGDNNNKTKLIVLSAPELFISTDIYSESVYKNKDFLLKTIAWLADDESDVIISSKPLAGSPLMMETMKQAYTIIAIVCIAIPLVFFMAGMVVFIRRKNL